MMEEQKDKGFRSAGSLYMFSRAPNECTPLNDGCLNLWCFAMLGGSAVQR